MLARRLLIFVAVLLGLTALANSFAPRELRRSEPATSAPAPAPVVPALPRDTELEAATPPSARDVPGEPPLRRLEAAGTGQMIEVEAGKRVRLAVTTDAAATIQIGEDGPLEPAEADSPARFDLLYTQPARIPILVAGADPRRPRAIGELRVVAAG